MNSIATKHNILVVDDDPLNRQLVARTLARAGFLTTTASNGDEAMDQIIIGLFAAVVSDVQMPRMSGLELLRNIRVRLPQLPVILMTGLVEDHIREAASIWGATALFQKPVDRADLILALKVIPFEPAQLNCEFFPAVESAACARW